MASNSFSFALTATPGKAGSKLVLGGVNPDYAATPFVYYPLVSETYWMIGLENVQLGENETGPIKSIVDTGTSVIVGPKNLVGPLI